MGPQSLGPRNRRQNQLHIQLYHRIPILHLSRAGRMEDVLIVLQYIMNQQQARSIMPDKVRRRTQLKSLSLPTMS